MPGRAEVPSTCFRNSYAVESGRAEGVAKRRSHRTDVASSDVSKGAVQTDLWDLADQRTIIVKREACSWLAGKMVTENEQATQDILLDEKWGFGCKT